MGFDGTYFPCVYVCVHVCRIHMCECVRAHSPVVARGPPRGSLLTLVFETASLVGLELALKEGRHTREYLGSVRLIYAFLALWLQVLSPASGFFLNIGSGN